MPIHRHRVLGLRARPLLLVLGWGLGCCFASSAIGQQPDSALAPLVESVDVRVVNVDVLVLDKKGKPVSDLTREDFLLKEDGRAVEITNFYSTSGDDDLDGEMEWVETEEGQKPRPVRADAPTFVFFFDQREVDPATLKRVIGGFDDLVESWRPPPGSRYLVAQRRGSLQLSDVLYDMVEVRAELDRVLEESYGRGIDARMSRRRVLSDIASIVQGCETGRRVPCDDCWEDMIAVGRRHAGEETARADSAIGALADLTSALAGIEGQKVAVTFNSGIPQRPGIDVFSYLGEYCTEREREVMPEILQYDLTSSLNQLTAHANSNRVSFYTVDAPGIRASSLASVDSDNRALTPSAENDRVRTANLQNSIFMLASETGGKSILNSNRPAVDLEEDLTDLDSRYSLGFVPNRDPTGRVHVLGVELVGKAAKGRRVVYRRSYRDKKVDTRLAERLLSFLFLGSGGNELGVELASAGQTASGKKRQVSVELSVPTESVVRTPGPNGELGQVRVWMLAVDSDGRSSGMRQQRITVGAPQAGEQGSGQYRFVVELELSQAAQTVVAGLRDEIAATESFARLQLDAQ